MESVQAAIKALPRDDKLLSVEQVCKILNVSEQWVYHNAKKLPFVRKVGGLLRFSNNGLQRYIESTKFSMKGSLYIYIYVTMSWSQHLSWREKHRCKKRP
jgi:excisionase family DNA binding protein